MSSSHSRNRDRGPAESRARAVSFALPLLVLGLGLAAPGIAQNRVQNARFDANVTGWAAQSETTIARGVADAHFASYSGSITVTNRTTPGHYGKAAIQCVDGVGPGTYTLRAFYFLPPGQNPANYAYLVAVPYSAAGCNSAPMSPGTGQSGFGLTVGTWERLESQVTMPAGTASVYVMLEVVKNEAGGQMVSYFDDVFFGPRCQLSTTNLCVAGNRFGIRANWQTGDGQTGTGTPIPLSSDTGYFWFFGPANVEAVIKVLDACSYNRRFWVYAGGLTDVKVDLTVTDFETNTSKTYSNPLGKPFQPVQDSNAFATCP